MSKIKPELEVITRMYDLVIWGSNHVAKFPRTHRFTLGDRLQMRLFHLLELLLRAKFTSDRVQILRDVNLELEMLRFQFRIAKDLKCISLDSFGHAARTVDDVGKLVGGWLRSSQSKT